MFVFQLFDVLRSSHGGGGGIANGIGDLTNELVAYIAASENAGYRSLHIFIGENVAVGIELERLAREFRIWDEADEDENRAAIKARWFRRS